MLQLEEPMATRQTKNWEVAKVEYESALEHYRHHSSLRRRDMFFAVTIQGAVLAIVGEDLPSLGLVGFLLSFVAFFALLASINAERRVSAYMAGYMQRANQIEAEYGMSLLSMGRAEVKTRKALFSNTLVFPLCHLIFIVAWIGIWGWNLLRLLGLVK
jgi:hypothetical protein